MSRQPKHMAISVTVLLAVSGSLGAGKAVAQPIGQQLALKHLETYSTYPPLQTPASYNLDQVMSQIESQKQDVSDASHPSQ